MINKIKFPDTFVYYLSVIVLSLTLVSCGILGSDDDDPNVFEDGLSPAIWNMIDEELLSVLEDSLKVPVHRGDNPPDIESMLGKSLKSLQELGVTVVMKPFIMTETVVPNDPCGHGGCSFWDLYIRMSGQDFSNYSIDIDTRHVEEPEYTGLGGFIVGEDDRFSIFAEQQQEREDRIVKSVNLFSGIVTSEGVDDPHLAFIMVENGGFEDLIPNGTGRSFIDEDGLAEITHWPTALAKSDPGVNIPMWKLFLKDR